MGAGSAAAGFSENIHASCVAFGARAVLIRGASGSGKSGLALQLMAVGADLVADDRTCIRREGDALWADAPATIKGQIEARGVGILTAAAVGPRAVALVVDMDAVETARLPEPDHVTLAGMRLPLLKKSDMPHFYAAIALYLRQDC